VNCRQTKPFRTENGDGHLGQRMRKLRIGQGYSQQEIARAVHVTSRTIQRWEADEAEPYLGEPLRGLASFLRVTPGFLLTGDKEDE